ncbi:MAG: hypothetical protein JSR69_20440 [Proteobacteria bacterium]|nr:hypothetical protein [Pseudomonadota bacterium]
MSIFTLFGKKTSGSPQRGIVDYGHQKKDGSHDHRCNRGEDRTPAQKKGDKKHGKSGSD